MPRFSVIPASYVFLVRGDSVLLQLRHNTGYMDGHWTAGAAGHIEQGETAHAAAVREVREELGVTVVESGLRATSVMQRTDGSDDPREQRVDWFFSCDSWTGEPAIQEPEKAEDLRWFPLTDLPDRIPAYERLALDWLRDESGVGMLSVGFTDL